MAERGSDLRERRRAETRRQIADAALNLFGTHGYEATTLDAIAAAAGISRRTFFHYFRSKDEILLSLQEGLGETLLAALERTSGSETPLQAVYRALMRVASSYSDETLRKIDPIMRASEAVQSRKNASYIKEEAMFLAGLRSLWPDASPVSLHLVASIAIASARISLDTWRAEGGTRSLAAILSEAFTALETRHRD